MTAVPQNPVQRGLVIAAIVAVLDQISKWAILDRFMDDPTPVEVLPFFNLVLTWNRGISFGMGNNGGEYNVWIFTGLAVVIVAALFYWLRQAETKWIVLALGGVIGGAIGNVIDRLRFGGVVDFLDIHIGDLHWPAFNVADSAIVVGAMLLIADALFRKGDSE